jgi:hypothetical protein
MSQFLPRSKRRLGYKKQLVLYREIVAVSSKIHINTLCVVECGIFEC